MGKVGKLSFNVLPDCFQDKKADIIPLKKVDLGFDTGGMFLMSFVDVVYNVE